MALRVRQPILARQRLSHRWDQAVAMPTGMPLNQGGVDRLGRCANPLQRALRARTRHRLVDLGEARVSKSIHPTSRRAPAAPRCSAIPAHMPCIGAPATTAKGGLVGTQHRTIKESTPTDEAQNALCQARGRQGRGLSMLAPRTPHAAHAIQRRTKAEDRVLHFRAVDLPHITSTSVRCAHLLCGA